VSRRGAALFLAVTLAMGTIVGAVAGALLAEPGASPLALASPGSSPTSTVEPSGNVAPAEPSPVPVATAEQTATPTPAPTPVMVPAPLTGLPTTPALASRHVVAVMVDDQVDARPQSGFSQAGIVWQAPADGGIPRYMMLFGDGDPVAVGPVRSARYYFIAWASEWNAVYVHVGGSPQALSTLHSAQGRGGLVYDADEFRYGGKYLWRIKQRSAPHNVYTDGSHLQALVQLVGAKPVPSQAPIWQYGAAAGLSSRPDGGTIVVPYLANQIRYTYDRATNTYPRSVTGEASQTDAGSTVRVAPTNVVIISMAFAPLNDGSAKHRLEAQLAGRGTAWIATNGRTVKGSWSKQSVSAPTLLFGPDGKPATLTPGQTFVQVVQTGTRITINDGTVPVPVPSQAAL
jgi:hypothetical protein